MGVLLPTRMYARIHGEWIISPKKIYVILELHISFKINFVVVESVTIDNRSGASFEGGGGPSPPSKEKEKRKKKRKKEIREL